MELPELTFEQAWQLRDSRLTYQGWVLGLRHALGLLLEAKGLRLSQDQEERVKAKSIDELFVE